MVFIGKRGYAIAFNSLIGWLIALLVLALAIILIFVLKGQGEGAIEFLKNLFNFGGRY